MLPVKNPYPLLNALFTLLGSFALLNRCEPAGPLEHIAGVKNVGFSTSANFPPRRDRSQARAPLQPSVQFVAAQGNEQVLASACGT